MTKIIEALKEFPLIDKKIARNRRQLDGYSSIVLVGDDMKPFDLPFGDMAKQQLEVDALLQSTRDLTIRHGNLKRRLSLTNATVMVTISGETKSITEWIAFRQSGASYLLHAQQALTNSAAEAQVHSRQTDTSSGFKTHRFFSEKERNDEIERLTDLVGSVDSTLEIVNATTDLLETPKN